MPRNFFRFPTKDQPGSPPAPPPKPEQPRVSAPIPLNETIRSRRVTSPVVAPGLGVPPGTAQPRLPHRASASDSFAQGMAWRNRQPAPATQMNQGQQVPERPIVPDNPTRRPLRHAKGHQPIADERERRSKAEALLREQTKLRHEINEDTIRLNRIKQMQQELRDEREKAESARQERFSGQGMGSNAYYAKSQSTPVLPESSPYARGRPNACSNESFRSASSQDPDFRYLHSRTRTPSVSSNDRSPPPAPHWQRVEQARRERERERALLKLAEARALEKKKFEEAWTVYESRWYLLNFATRTSPVLPTNANGSLTLSFADIPWPLLHPPRSCEAITIVGIKAFLLSEHQATDKSHRDRIKEALLRWHPDRFEGRIMEHVREIHRPEVKKGVDIVVRCLNELLSKA